MKTELTSAKMAMILPLALDAAAAKIAYESYQDSAPKNRFYDVDSADDLREAYRLACQRVAEAMFDGLDIPVKAK